MGNPFSWPTTPPPTPAPAAPVTSVFGRIGAIVATLGDYVASKITNDSGVAGATVKDALDTLAAAAPAVASVFGRVGAVVAAAGDYAASQINNDSAVAGAHVSNALNTLNAAIAALVTGVSSVYGRAGAVVAVAGDYVASQVNNDSGVSGATVKAALDTLNGVIFPYYGTFAGRPAAGNAGRIAVLTDAPIGVWVDSGSAWQPVINNALGIAPPLVAAMTALNQGGATFTDQKGSIAVVGVNDGASPGQLRGMTVANAAASAYARACIQFQAFADVTANHFSSSNVILRESGTGKIYALNIYQDANARRTNVAVDVWTSTAARASSTDKGYTVFDPNGPIMGRVRRSGANVIAEISRNGVDWFVIDTRTTVSVFTTAPDQAGWACSGINMVPTFNVVSFESGS